MKYLLGTLFVFSGFYISIKALKNIKKSTFGSFERGHYIGVFFLGIVFVAIEVKIVLSNIFSN